MKVGKFLMITAALIAAGGMFCAPLIIGVGGVFLAGAQCASVSSDTVGATLSSSGIQLPQATVDYLASRDIKSLAQQNIAAYMDASKNSGVPWQALAALHYREGGMNPSQSLADGEPILGHRYKSVDGATIGANLDDDANLAAQHFISLAKGVYGVDVTKPDMTLAEWGEAFLAYNRGYLYSFKGVPYSQSPYVMNGFDDQHMHMSWTWADTVSGKDGNKAGALTVMAYLEGMPLSALESGACAEANGASGTVVPPVSGGGLRITSPYGWRMLNGAPELHEGIDIIGGNGKIVAAEAGNVVMAKDGDGDCGTAVMVDVGNSMDMLYCHMVSGSLLVTVGQQVTAGQQIGIMGETGDAQGVHLHFQINIKGKSTDPEPILAQYNIRFPHVGG